MDNDTTCGEVKFSEAEYWEKRFIESQKDLKTAQDMILELFAQSTLINGLYDHLHISTYEYAQDYLLEKGLITEAQCYRK